MLPVMRIREDARSGDKFEMYLAAVRLRDSLRSVVDLEAALPHDEAVKAHRMLDEVLELIGSCRYVDTGV